METNKDDTKSQESRSGEQPAQGDLSGKRAGERAGEMAGGMADEKLDESPDKKPDDKPKVRASMQDMTLWQTTQSVLFAMLGVQTSKNAKRDFSKGKASHFIVIGVVFGVLFVLSVVLAVNLILSAIDA